MNRGSFIKKAALATAGAFAAPYILPSDRLFAASGVRKVNHVVFCLFAGGIRNLESVQKAEGNLMRYMLNGSEAISSDIIGGMDSLPLPAGAALQTYGTLFKEFRYSQGPTGHFNGHTTAVTGVYTDTTLDIKTHPAYPTIFEYYRKHSAANASPLNSWWISNMLGPYPSLNYSNDINYGALFGANYVQPTSLINWDGAQNLSTPKSFSAGEEQAVKDLRSFFNKNFIAKNTAMVDAMSNNETDAASLKAFIQQSFTEALAGTYSNPWNISSGMSNDMHNIFFTEKILQKFKPELLVVNMQDVDIAHSNFTEYCNGLRKSDYAVAHLWQTIQSTPGLANDTILIIAPEHGRNLTPNSIIDSYGRPALDHTSDDTSREIFCMVLGPSNVVKQNQVISTIQGESIDIVPTIANILGFENDIPSGYRSRMGNVLTPAFV